MNQQILYFAKKDNIIFVKDLISIILKNDILTVKYTNPLGQVLDFIIAKDDHINIMLINKYLDHLDMTYEMKCLVLGVFASL